MAWFQMIYRGPGLFIVAQYGSSPTPLPTPLSPSSNSDTQEDWERRATCWQRGGVVRVGKEPDHTTAGKAWSSINHSILSGTNNGNVQSGRRFSILKPIKNWIRILHQVLHIKENLKKVWLSFTAYPVYTVILVSVIDVIIFYFVQYIEIFWKKYSLAIILVEMEADSNPDPDRQGLDPDQDQPYWFWISIDLIMAAYFWPWSVLWCWRPDIWTQTGLSPPGSPQPSPCTKQCSS